MMETERLIIRSFEKSDSIKCYENWGQDESIGRYITMFPMKALSEMNALVSCFAKNPNVWLIEEKITHEPVGYISVDIPYEWLGVGEIGYALGEKFRRRGYAKEALKRVISYLFEERQLYLIEAKYNETNQASAGLLNGLGFRTDGVLRAQN